MRNKRKFSWFRLLLVVVVAYFGYVSIHQQSSLDSIERERQVVEARLGEAQQQNDALTAEKKKLQEAAYLEKIAREELGLVKPGEMPYISTN